MADVVYFDGGIDLPFCPPTVNGIYISGSGCCSEFYSAFIGGNQTYNLTYTLPTASGTNGQVLTNDGNGNLSWTTVSGGGGGTGTLTGTGTTNYLSKWASASGLTDSIILETGSTIDISGALRVTASSGTATAVMGRDANGYVSNLSLGNGLSISGGTLSFTGSTGVSGNFVPYLGATGNTDLGGYGIAGSYFQLSTSTGGTLVPGMFSWNGTDGTADLMLKGGTVTLPIGETQLARVINETGANLLKSQYNIVRVNGSTGTRLKVALALASGDATSAETLGIVAENITLNQEGFVITSGIIRGINTTGSLQGETWLDGDMLFLSPFVAGALTNIKPQAPNHLVVIGYVVTAANNGVIYVKVDNGYELDELHNVLISSAATNEILAYDGVASVWKNRTSAQLNLASGTGTTNYLTKWLSSSGLTNSIILETGSTVDIAGALRVTASSGTSISLMGRDANGYVSGISVGSGLSLSGNTLTTTGTTGGLISLNALTGSTQTFAVGTAGTDFTISSTGTVHSFNLPTASSTNRGALSSADWSTFNGKLGVVSSILAIPANNVTVTTPSFASQFNFQMNAGRQVRLIGDSNEQTNDFNLVLQKNYATTIGTFRLDQMMVNPTINQTLSANGIMCGVRISPTLTSAPNWRSIEWSNNIGYGLYGVGTANNYLGGNTSIGVVTPSARLHVVGSGTTSASTSFLVQNNTSNNMFSVLDNGNIGVNTNNPQQTLHIEGTMRLTGSTGTGTTLMGRNASGDVSAISIGSGLSLSGNTLSSTGSTGVSGSGVANQVAFWGGSTTLNGSSLLTWNGSTLSANIIEADFATGRGLRLSSGVLTINRNNNLLSPNLGVGIEYTQPSYNSGHVFTHNGTFNSGAGLSSWHTQNAMSPSSNNFYNLYSRYTINNSAAQTGTADGIRIHGTETSLNGITHNLINAGVGSTFTSRFRVNNLGSVFSGPQSITGLNTTSSTAFVVQSSASTNLFAVLDNGQIGVNTATPNTSSIFQIDSTTLGFLPPRMSTTNKTGIASPAQGLVVYDTTMQALSAYNGSNWATVGGGEQMFTITGSTATINFNAGNIVDITLATSTTLTLTGGTFGTFIIKLTQDATGGRVVSWPSNVRWSGGIPPSLTTTGGKVDVISLIFDGTNYYGTYALNF